MTPFFAGQRRVVHTHLFPVGGGMRIAGECPGGSVTLADLECLAREPNAQNSRGNSKAPTLSPPPPPEMAMKAMRGRRGWSYPPPPLQTPTPGGGGDSAGPRTPTTPPPPPLGASGRQLVVKGMSPRSQRAPKAPRRQRRPTGLCSHLAHLWAFF